MSEKTEAADQGKGALAASVPETGRLLGLSRNASYEAAARGDIPTVRIGGRIFVPRKALDALLDTATENWRRHQELAAAPGAQGGPSRMKKARPAWRRDRAQTLIPGQGNKSVRDT
jgi:hypothetical protein